jgi:hypothetical protein
MGAPQRRGVAQTAHLGGKEVSAQMKDEKKDSREWEPIEATDEGHVGEVLQGGGGKLSTSPGDPGEPRKPKGQEP